MWFSVSEQFTVMGYSVLMGIFFGIVYDFVKITRVLQGISIYSRIFHKMDARSLPLVGYRFSAPKMMSNSSVAIVILFLGDILYSVFCAAAYSLFLFHSIRGQVRWYFIIATAIGFFLYYFTVSRLVLVLFETLILGIRIFLVYTWELFLLPLRLVRKFCNNVIKLTAEKVIAPFVLSRIYRIRLRYTEKIRQDLNSQIKFDQDL